MKNMVKLLLPLLLVQLQAIAQTDFWQLVGGTESIHEIIDVAFHPNGSIFLASDLGGMYRSTDGGVTWSAIDEGLTTPYMRCLLVDTHGHIFLGTDSRIFKSTDNGDHWVDVNLSTGYWVNSIVSGGDNTLFAEFGYGIYRSTDDGVSWSALPFDILPLGGKMVRTSGGALIAGDARKGIYSSTDDGQTWILKKKLHEREPQFGFLIAVGGDGNVYAAKTGPEPGLITKFFVSSNNGEAWRQRSVRRNPNSITTPIFSSLFALPGSQLFAGDFSRGVIVCSTLGRSWRQLNSGLSTEVGTFSLTFGPDGHLYAGTSSGLYRSSQAASATLPIALGEGYYSEPKSFALSQNYPNPFNPTTSIGFDLAGMSRVTLKVYNTLGQEVVTVIHNELMDEGAQEVEFDASTLPSGAYFYRLTAERLTDEGGIETGGAFTAMKKMLLLK